ncbi:MAG: epoxyqueuosine reductase QueH [Candidatus Omnitrophica bacterium]|nr:epoxyqueuosine reductase QueH [Candidatus Omnitrophota bacterium]
MDILLHICCGPCLIYPFGRLKEEGFNIKGFYYNPNIYPSGEYSKRKGALEVLSRDLEFDVESPQYDDSEFFQAINANENTPERCINCWSLRLRRTAKHAKENNLFLFSTTLLVSPYQDHTMLKELGEKIAKETGVDFFYEDFRPGFRQAYKEARQKGLYLQKYCGCNYSIKPKVNGLNEK